MTYLQLSKIADTYYDVWTSDGIDAFHADRDEISAWLRRADLRTESDAVLADLTDVEIGVIADMIADKVEEEMKKKYIITYRDRRVVRIADSAEHAIDKLCDQYGWRSKLDMYDADTRGKEFAQCSVDTEGGINWNLTIYAERAE